MRTLYIGSLLVLAPALIGAGSDDLVSKLERLIVLTLPSCADNEYLTYEKGGLGCRPIAEPQRNLPDCYSQGQLLTYTVQDGSGVYGCADRGTESLDAADIARINQTLTRLQSLKTTVNSLTAVSQPTAARFCGQYNVTRNPDGAIVGINGLTGAAGAASLCSSLASCGPGARMCTVYDMYNSVVHAKIPSVLSQSWVHLSAWQHNDPAQVPTANGLADNCAGWTYPASDTRFYGTTVEWKNAPSGLPALHFQSGTGLVSCASRYPIACCR
jgi:hypothetical protein